MGYLFARHFLILVAQLILIAFVVFPYPSMAIGIGDDAAINSDANSSPTPGTSHSISQSAETKRTPSSGKKEETTEALAPGGSKAPTPELSEDLGNTIETVKSLRQTLPANNPRQLELQQLENQLEQIKTNVELNPNSIDSITIDGLNRYQELMRKQAQITLDLAKETESGIIVELGKSEIPNSDKPSEAVTFDKTLNQFVAPLLEAKKSNDPIIRAKASSLMPILEDKVITAILPYNQISTKTGMEALASNKKNPKTQVREETTEALKAASLSEDKSSKPISDPAISDSKYLSASEQLGLSNHFADEAIQSLGINNGKGNLNLEQASLFTNIPNELKPFASDNMKQIANASISPSLSRENTQRKVDSITRLSNSDDFQSYLSKRLDQDARNRFNYNAVAAETLNGFKKVPEEIAKTLKDFVQSKTTKQLPTLEAPVVLTQVKQDKKGKVLSSNKATASSGTSPFIQSKTIFPDAASFMSLPKDFLKGTSLSTESAEWIELARFLTSPEGLRSAEQRKYNVALLQAGRQELELLLTELKQFNSLDLSSLLQIPLPTDPKALIRNADETARKSFHALIHFVPEQEKLTTKREDKKIPTDSQHTLSYLQAEAESTQTIYLRLGDDLGKKNQALLMTKTQVLNSLLSRKNIEETWLFYEPQSFQMLKRATGALTLARRLLTFEQIDDSLGYLYRYTQKELQVRAQIASERAAAEGKSARAPASKE